MKTVYRSPADCPICKSPLDRSHELTEDKVYGIEGRWNFAQCSNPQCGALFLRHDLTDEELDGFYQTYSTHSPPVIDSHGLKALYRGALKQIWHDCLGYPAAQRGAARALGKILGRVSFFREEALARVFWLRHRPGGTLIEVGFGNAQGMVILREAGWQVRGTEMDDSCVSQARSLGLNAIKGNFADGLFQPSSVDAIVGSHVIEHVPDHRAFLLEARRVLRPGGNLVLRTPNAASRDARRYGPSWRGLEPPRHLSIHTPGSLASLAKACGYDNVQIWGTPLGGFCVQQSGEIHSGRRPSARQGFKTLFHHFAETVRTIADNRSSSEIVLLCSKPAMHRERSEAFPEPASLPKGIEMIGLSLAADSAPLPNDP